jgi:polyisoprenyl-teichoic acid--peptidoglycan teichoic acid transferase
MLRKWFFIAAIISLLTACAVRAQVQTIDHPISLLVTPDPNATATRTPFQPVAPTTTRIITSTPTLIPPTPTPEVTPTPTQPVLPKGVVNIMVLGIDWRPNSGGRTDTMILVSVNQDRNTVSIVSFPRDLYVLLPGRGNDRLNTAKPYGGFALLQDTMQANFWVRPDYYISTNMQGFVKIIDTLGGINVYASQYLTDRCDLPQAEEGNCRITPGQQWMDGDTALWYVRSRATSNDFDRTRRAQEVMLALFNRLFSMNAIARAPDLYRQFKGSVETDMDLEEMLKLAPVAARLNEPDRIKRYTIGHGETIDYRTDSGARVLLPIYEAIYPIIMEAVYSP